MAHITETHEARNDEPDLTTPYLKILRAIKSDKALR